MAHAHGQQTLVNFALKHLERFSVECRETKTKVIILQSEQTKQSEQK